MRQEVSELIHSNSINRRVRKVKYPDIHKFLFSLKAFKHSYSESIVQQFVLLSDALIRVCHRNMTDLFHEFFSENSRTILIRKQIPGSLTSI